MKRSTYNLARRTQKHLKAIAAILRHAQMVNIPDVLEKLARGWDTRMKRDPKE